MAFCSKTIGIFHKPSGREEASLKFIKN